MLKLATLRRNFRLFWSVARPIILVLYIVLFSYTENLFEILFFVRIIIDERPIVSGIDLRGG